MPMTSPPRRSSPGSGDILKTDSGSSSSSPLQRKTSLSPSSKEPRQRWTSAAKKILQGNRLSKRDKPPIDILGERLTFLLNQNPRFRYQRNERNHMAEGEELLEWKKPLLSYHNLLLLVNKRNEKPNNSRGERPAVISSAIFFVRLWTATMVLVSLFISQVLVSASSFLLWTVTPFVSAYLFDWREIYERGIPLPLRKLIQMPISASIACWRGLQSRINRRYVGREWTTDEFVWHFEKPLHLFFATEKENLCPAVISSQHQSLWDLPPPSQTSMEQAFLFDGSYVWTWMNRQRMSKDSQWSMETAQHLTAVHFCYDMMQRQYRQKQETENLRRVAMRSTSSAPSISILLAQDHIEEETDQQLRTRSASAVLTETQQIRYSDSYSPSHRREITVIPSTPATEVQQPFTGEAFRNTSPSEAIELRMDSQQSSLRDLFQEAEDSKESRSVSQEDNDDDSSSNGSSGAADLPWVDVGAKIGLRFLNSAHVQRAITSQDTTERIFEMQSMLDAELNANTRPNTSAAATKPIHSMWTSPAAAGAVVASVMSEEPSQSALLEDDMSTTTDLPRSESLQSFKTSDETDHGIMKSPSDSLGLTKARFVPKRRRVVNTRSEEALPCLSSPRYQELRHSSSLDECDQSPRKHRRPQRRHRPGDFLSISAHTAGETALSFGFPSRRAHRSPRFRSSPSRYKKREPLKPGVKVAVPLFPYQPGSAKKPTQFEMGTVVSSRRIFVVSSDRQKRGSLDPNYLSVTVKLDRCFLRNGEFSELTFRVADEWSNRYMPRHSKVPIGSCVATCFGIGVLVGWRVEDDCHVVRSLWQRRGVGSAHAYLNRDTIHGCIEAASGFYVDTNYGHGVVLACVNGGRTYEDVKYFVAIKDEGPHNGHVLELGRHDIRSCHGAQFIPIIEHIREAAKYQLQVDNYKAAARAEKLAADPTQEEKSSVWHTWAECLDIFWDSFLQAVDEDSDFDKGVNEFMSEIILFLDRLGKEDNGSESIDKKASIGVDAKESTNQNDVEEPGLWVMDDLLGGIFTSQQSAGNNIGSSVDSNTLQLDPDEKTVTGSFEAKHYNRAYAVLRVLMKTVTTARAASVKHPQFRLSLAVQYEILLFIRTIIRVQQKNSSAHSLEVWKRAWEEIVTTFGPIKDRLEKIGSGIKQRMESQGRKAKTRLLRFVDYVLSDERLLIALEQGDWGQCGNRLEFALLKARIVEEESIKLYRKTFTFLFTNLTSVLSTGGEAASRNSEKLNLLAKIIQSVASPKRSILNLICRDDVLEILESILIRTYCKEEVASRMLGIHASNFHSLRHLRMLKDFSVAGRIWIPLVDAADEEFSSVVSQLTENWKEFMCPISNLFSLCVAQFHKINAGDLSKDWLAFLLEDDAVRIIQEIDMKLILALEAFSCDVRDMMVVLPYYPSIDDDILNLVDEVDLDTFLKEAAEAMDNSEGMAQFLKEKVTVAIERFLNYLPKMSIPVEKRDLGGEMKGWVLTCRGEDGGDLTLSDVNIRRENLICRIMGGDSIFFPMFGDDDDKDTASESVSTDGEVDPREAPSGFIEESVLDDIREMLLQAQRHGCWKAGVGGVAKPPTDRYVASILKGLPVSTVLNCGIELWRNLEIDDDELMEIAIKDVSYQIQLQGELEDTPVKPSERASLRQPLSKLPSGSLLTSEQTDDRFNPRVNPTVLFLDMTNLKLHLDNFFFRIEKKENRTVFDPIFEGRGMVSLQNISIRLRIDCAKEGARKIGESVSPVLFLRELDVQLEKVRVKVKDTGFGSDWLLNRAVDVFTENITKVVEDNLKEQIALQVKTAISNINASAAVNPTLFLSILGITMDDLNEENVLWV